MTYSKRPEKVASVLK